MAATMLNFVSNTYRFDPSTSIPELTNKIIIVTGGNNGVGKESVRQLAAHHPSRIYLAARSQQKFDTALTDITNSVPNARDIVKFLELDLASFASVKSAASKVLAECDRLDILMSNAGVMALPPGLTKDGYEIQFGTNHMGHALFTKLLTPLLLKTAEKPGSDVRIINLSSAGHMVAPKPGFLPEKVVTDMRGFHTYTRYGQSKLANILFSRELDRRYAKNGILVAAVHPGRVQTELLNTFNERWSITAWMQRAYDWFVIMDVKKGAWSQLWAATADRRTADGKGQVESGKYYEPVGKALPGTPLAQDMKVAAELWQWQEAEFKKHGY